MVRGGRCLWCRPILTIEELLAGAKVDMPPPSGTFKQAPKADRAGGKQEELGL